MIIFSLLLSNSLKPEIFFLFITTTAPIPSPKQLEFHPPNHYPISTLLVPLANQVVCQSLNSGRGISSNLLLAVVANNNGLLRLGNGDTESAL